MAKEDNRPKPSREWLDEVNALGFAITDRRITAAQFRLWSLLQRRFKATGSSRGVLMSYRMINTLLGMNNETISDAIEHLENLGYLRRVKAEKDVEKPWGHRPTTCYLPLYTFAEEMPRKGAEEMPRKGAEEMPRKGAEEMPRKEGEEKLASKASFLRRGIGGAGGKGTLTAASREDSEGGSLQRSPDGMGSLRSQDSEEGFASLTLASSEEADALATLANGDFAALKRAIAAQECPAPRAGRPPRSRKRKKEFSHA